MFGVLKVIDTTPALVAPAEWIEILAEGEADIVAGRIVSEEDVMRDLRESLARLHRLGRA